MNTPPATPPLISFALGRSNHGSGYHTSRFRANPYMPTVTASQTGTRPSIIALICKPE